MHLSYRDRALLDQLQEDMPLCHRPYLQVAEKLQSTENSVIRDIEWLFEQGVLRRIGPIIDPAATGLASTLVAVAAPPESREAVAALISESRHVTHNYLRQARNRNLPYNIWFTFTAEDTPEFPLQLENLMQQIALPYLNLPRIRKFKINVRFKMVASETNAGSGRSKDELPVVPLSTRDRKILNVLANGLPLSATPYSGLAIKTEMDEEEVIQRLNRMRKLGVIRRLSASVASRRAGFSANAMCVFDVPQDQIESVGYRLAQSPKVTHCYQRVSYNEWPFNLYVMVHAGTAAECEKAAEALAEQAGVSECERVLLFSEREFKKVWTRL